MYSDQTGRFTITSASRHKYTMVAVELDGNYIDAEPIKSRLAKELTEAYKRIYARWNVGRVRFHWLVLILMLVSIVRGRRIRLASKIPFYLL